MAFLVSLETAIEERRTLIDSSETDAYRIIHGASDGFPGLFIDRLGDYLLASSANPPGVEETKVLELCKARFGSTGIYFKHLNRHVRQMPKDEASPRLLGGKPAPEYFAIREHSLKFRVSFNEGYSTGIFLDQRDNRRRLLEGGFLRDPKLAGKRPTEITLLNVFAYTCCFSVAAARAGMTTRSLDLSKKYLEWGKENFRVNGLNPEEHDFIFGDAWDWLKRLVKKGLRFDIILLDPPTFSKSKTSGVFQAPKDYPRLVQAALPLLNSPGILFVSTNASHYSRKSFLKDANLAIAIGGRKVLRETFVPQPSDFPGGPRNPAYLKTCWFQVQ